MRSAVLFVLAIAFSVVCLKFAPSPYGIASMGWCAWLLYNAARVTGAQAKQILLASAAIIFSLGIIELGLWMADTLRPKAAWRYSESFIVRDDELGYAPVKSKRVFAELSVKGRHIYSATYTFDQDGHRLTPGGIQSKDCVLFFGDSYTFGEGVEDSQTMPWMVGAESGYSVINFGFGGYGPHQMLAKLEANRLHQTIRCRPQAVVYQAIGEHPGRASGYSPWDRHGPKYVLTGHGLVQGDHFDDHFQELAMMQLTKSFLFQQFVFFAPPLVRHRTELFIEIVDAARRQASEQFPDAAFEVIFWNARDRLSVAVAQALRARRIRTRLVSDILPGYPDDASLYEHSPYDRHPNPMAHQLIAGDVMRTLLHRRDAP